MIDSLAEAIVFSVLIVCVTLCFIVDRVYESKKSDGVRAVATQPMGSK